MKRSRVLNHKEAIRTAFGHCHVTFQPKEKEEISQDVSQDHSAFLGHQLPRW